MTNRRALVPAAIVAGIFFLAVALMYWVLPAKSLPVPDFLGHQAGSTHHHVKHGIAAFILAVGCFILAWFQSGPRRAAG
ncbi:MAG: hypothetical protein ACXVYV_00245 [Gaiellales bacterium]